MLNIQPTFINTPYCILQAHTHAHACMYTHTRTHTHTHTRGTVVKVGQQVRTGRHMEQGGIQTHTHAHDKHRAAIDSTAGAVTMAGDLPSQTDCPAMLNMHVGAPY